MLRSAFALSWALTSGALLTACLDPNGTDLGGSEGSTTDPSPAFKALRDTEPMREEPSVAARRPGPGARLVLGADGRPQQNGTMDVKFTVVVPNSAF